MNAVGLTIEIGGAELDKDVGLVEGLGRTVEVTEGGIGRTVGLTENRVCKGSIADLANDVESGID
jgi:hypothetical protein